MAKHNVLLVCGSGASSGFMAANMRKAASARGMEERCEGYDVKVAVIEKDAYAHLNGDKALDQVLALFGE